MNKGINLVETMVALMILSIIGGAVILLTLQVLSLNNSARLRSRATFYAEGSLEQARGYTQTNGWQALSNLASPGGSCYIDAAAWTSGTCDDACSLPANIAGTIFYRYIRLTKVGGSQVKVATLVSWREKGVCQKVQVDTAFFSY